MPSMTIGKLATLSGVSVDTVRYYEQYGLLPACERSDSGYRLYQQEAQQRIHFIRTAQALGFKLKEIRELLTLHDESTRDAGEVKHLVQEKIADIDSRIHSMQRIRDCLQGLANRCPGSGSSRDCPILAALATEDTGADGIIQECCASK